MKSIQRYLKRPLSAAELRRADAGKLAAEQAFERTYYSHGIDNVEVEVKITNRSNPNGLTITRKCGERAKVERFINMGWATRNGYATR